MFEINIIVIFVYYLIFVFGEDPCKDAENISNDLRNPSKTLDYEKVGLCDSYLMKDKWYKLGGKITNECVEVNRCSTFAGIWYEGDYPTGDETIKGTVCAINDKNDCCGWKGNIEIKKCPDNSYVYKLAIPPTCPMSYCVGEYVPCSANQVYYKNKRTCLERPTIKKIELGTPYISARKTIKTTTSEFKVTAFSIDCLLELALLPPVQAGSKLKVESMFKMNEDVVAMFVHDWPTPKIQLNETFLKGHLGKSLSCGVRFYYEFEDKTVTSKTDWIFTTKSFFFGFLPADASGNEIKEIKIRQSQTIKIYLKSTFPITTGHCLQDDNCYLRRYDFFIESPNKGLNAGNCFVTFGSITGETTYISMHAITVSGTSTLGREFSKTIVKFLEFHHVISRSIFEGYAITAIVVNIEDNSVQPTCHSAGDPHFSTFNRITFDNYFTGDFMLLQAKERTFEIQVRQIPCSGAITCNCGLIAREGNNILGVTACDNRKTPLAIEMMKDNVNPRATLEIRGNLYTMKFVSGIKIEMATFGTGVGIFLNINVYGLKDENYNGICAVKERNFDFNMFRVAYEKSFFQQKLPPCVNEVFNFPACQCDKSKDDTIKDSPVKCESKIGTSGTEIVKFENICDLKAALRRKKRAADNSTEEVKLTTPTRNSTNSKGFSMEDIFHAVNHSSDSSHEPAFTGFSPEEAKIKCQTTFKLSSVYVTCLTYMEKEEYPVLEKNCIDDIRLTGDVSIARQYLSTFEQTCAIKIGKEIVIIDGEIPASNKTLMNTLKEVESTMCPVCLNGGNCSNGSCVCSSDFGGFDCSLELNKPAVIKYASKDLVCDVSSPAWYMINLETTNLQMTKSHPAECNGRIVDKAGYEEVIEMTAKLVQNGYLQCSVDLDVFNKHRQQKSEVKLILFVSTMHGEKKLESNKLKLTIFDGVCLSCSSTLCNQKNNTCLIENVCYREKHLKDKSYQCIPSKSMTKWSKIENFAVVSKPAFWTIIVSIVLLIRRLF